MTELEIAYKVILAGAGGLIVLSGAWAVIDKIFNPFSVLTKRVEKLEGAHDQRDGDITNIKDMAALLCQSLIAMLDHEISGNSVDKLIEKRDNLMAYLAKK